LTDLASGGLRPVGGAERVVALDALRGFTILGILFVNIQLFRGPEIWQAFAGEEGPATERLLGSLITLFFEGKFINTLAFLFGLGIAIQTIRADERGQPSRSLMLRRLATLALFGLIHAVFIWSGDILLTYALLGFPLLLFRRRRVKTLLIWAGAMYGFATIIFLLLVGLTYLATTMPGAGQGQMQFSQEGFFRQFAELARNAYGSGTYAEMTVQRLRELAFFYINNIFTAPFLFAMLLLGVAVGRAGWMAAPEARWAKLRRVAVVGFAIGLPLNAFAAVARYADPAAATPSGLLGQTAQVVGAPVLSLGYASLVFLLALRLADSPPVRRLAAVGRLALTNYLAQSLIMTGIFYGLGLYGRVGLPMALLMCVAVAAAQLIWSPLYFRRFSQGPMEWLWRRLGYGRRAARPRPT
jgi:uncharacterized protein